jgi:uncharacterized protein HemX
MSVLTISITVGLALFLVIISGIFFSFWLYRLSQKCNELIAKNQSTELILSDLQSTHNELKEQINSNTQSTSVQLLEINQVSKQLEHRIKSLQQQTTNQEQQIESWQENQGQDKLYSRAYKLAEKGAEIDEIITECELPRAEAEMLLSVYHQRNNS